MSEKPKPAAAPPVPVPPTFDAATEAELDAAAEITPDDIARARVAWKRDASPAFRDLLDATPVDPAARRDR